MCVGLNFNIYPFSARYKSYWAPNLSRYDYTMLEGIRRIESPAGALSHTLNLLNEKFPVLFYTATLAKHVRAQLWADEWRNKHAIGPTDFDGLNLQKRLLTRQTVSVSTYLRNMDTVASMARGKDFGALICLQPAMGDDDKFGKVRKEKLVSAEIDHAATIKKVRPYKGEYFALARKMFEKRISKNTTSVQFCDLGELFRKQTEQMWLDDVHYTPSGNLVIARALLAKLGRLDEINR